MIGNDCKLIELNSRKFLTTEMDENWKSKSFQKMNQVCTLYDLFTDLTKDIRSMVFNTERAGSKEYYKTSVVTHIVMTRLDSNSPFRFLY